MIKCIQIGTIDAISHNKIEYEKFPLAITPHINCPKKFQRKYYGIFNKYNMGALNNYAKQENLYIFFAPVENDLTHNSSMTVFYISHNNNNKVYNTPLNLNIDTRDNFVKSIREIYKKVEEAVKNFSIKKTDK